MELEIQKWEVYVADLNPRFGTEPGKVRPVVAVQTNLLNGVHPSTVVCPLTTKVDPEAKYLRVHLSAREAGLEKPSDVLVDQIRAIDNQRLKKRLGKISRRAQKELAERLKLLLS